MSGTVIHGGEDALWSVYRSGKWWHWEAFWGRDRLSGWEQSRAEAVAEAKRWARVIEGRAPRLSA